MSADSVDHKQLARSRIATQYLESAKFIDWIYALLKSPQEIEDVMQLNALQTDLNIAKGVNLDTIGEIVGVNRYLPNTIYLEFFGFNGQPAVTTFGEEAPGDPSIGARFREEGENPMASSVLQDPEFLTLIKIKIIKNHSRGTGEDIIKAAALLFGLENVSYLDIGGMAIFLTIGRDFTLKERAMLEDLDILPRPAGVKLNLTFNYWFGFEDQIWAKTFGEENVPGTGGKFYNE